MKEYSTIFENDRSVIWLAHKSSPTRTSAQSGRDVLIIEFTEAIARELHLGGGENEAKVLVNEMAARSNIRGGVSAKKSTTKTW